ncbi:MAG: EAL domain-containing protein [Alphaproteobacteria bacterium]|nr:EAL domain-containing protein [Alphaproteobacteria bacterium]
MARSQVCAAGSKTLMWNRAGQGVVALLLVATALAAPARAAAGDPGIPANAPVVDLTRSLRPYDQAPPRDLGEPEAWFAFDLPNPGGQELTRVVTFDDGRDGAFRFLYGDARTAWLGLAPAGESGHAELHGLRHTTGTVSVASGQTATFAVRVRAPNRSSIWRLWQPDAYAARQRLDTLMRGLLAGCVLAMAAWLAGLSVARRSAAQGWAALALGSSVLLLLGESVIALPAAATIVAGGIFLATGFRFLSRYLDIARDRPMIAYLLDGCLFAIFMLAVVAAFDIGPAWLLLRAATVLAAVTLAVVLVQELAKGSGAAKALVPGALLVLLAVATPWAVPDQIARHSTALPLIFDAVLTAGILALGFAGSTTRVERPDEEVAAEINEERRQAREVEYRYALGLAAAHQGLWDWNLETDTLFLSPSVEALLGLPNSAIGSSERNWAALILPEDISVYADAMNTHRKLGNSSFTVEVRMRHAKGGLRWIQLRASCLAGSDGRAVRCIGVISDITVRKQQEAALTTSDQVDRVTGLIGRNPFASRLDEVLVEMQKGRTQRRGAVLAIDVDRVRLVNDSLGHKIGEQFLADIARRLDHAAGPEDAVARLGSEEFAVLALGSKGDEDGAEVAQRIRNALTQPIAIGDREIYPAASIGLALIEERHRFGGDVLREAEVAMYHAKRAGRGGFEIYQPQMKPRSAERLMLDADLRTALDRNEIELHYQPIIRLSDNSIAGFEALMRWRHPKRGLLSPTDFIPLAEETGLIMPLGQYAVDKAAAELKRWQSFFPMREPLFCSVNVSARQLFRQEFFDDVITALRRESPARLSFKLELTESVIMQDPDTTARMLGRLKDAGAGLALDDFGTGFSSLAYLQRFPFDTVKVDRSFIVDMATNSETPVILNSIIGLAHELDMSVVAEGVESQQEAKRLRELRCEFAQGFLFGAPMDSTAAYNFIALKGRTAEPRLPRPGSSPARIPR